MDSFQTFDHAGNDWLNDVDRELSCGSRGTEGVDMGTRDRCEKTIVYTVRTSLSKVIMKHG